MTPNSLLLRLALAPTKALIFGYTWSTLPAYALVQRPWIRLKRGKSFGLHSTFDHRTGRLVYSRPSPVADTVKRENPLMRCYSFNEMIPHLNRDRQVFGVRPVLSETFPLDSTGKPVKIDGKPLKRLKVADKYTMLTVGQVLDRVDALARGLTESGITSGDRVAIFAENSLEFVCTAFALQRINAVSITLLTILNNQNLAYCLNQCEARHLVTTQDLLTRRMPDICEHLAAPLNIIYIENPLKLNDESLRKVEQNLASKEYRISAFSKVEQLGATLPPSAFPSPKPTDPTLIMFTSGTTGNPKGVLFTHYQLAAKLHNYAIYSAETERSWFNGTHLAFLPLSHIMGYIGAFCFFIFKGKMAIGSPATMLDSSPCHVPGQTGDLRLVRPDYLTVVPLMLERILKEIHRKLDERGPFTRHLFSYLMKYKIRWQSRGFDTPIINRAICQKFNETFGGRLRGILVGSAPLNEQTEKLAQAALNVTLTQGYGSTEMSGGSHLSPEGRLGVGVVGIPFHSLKFYLKDWPEGGYRADDKPNPRGEIVVGGDVIAEGYYGLPEETKEAFQVDQDGLRWFNSGDIGELEADGTLRIIDRMKDLIKLANGEYVSLGKIESSLRTSPYVENICVCTEPFSNYVTALISPNRAELSKLATELKIESATFAQLIAHTQVKTVILENIKEISGKCGLSGKETPQAIGLVVEEWSQENNLLTPAFKLKRKQVVRFYEREIRKLFTEKTY